MCHKCTEYSSAICSCLFLILSQECRHTLCIRLCSALGILPYHNQGICLLHLLIQHSNRARQYWRKLIPLKRSCAGSMTKNESEVAAIFNILSLKLNEYAHCHKTNTLQKQQAPLPHHKTAKDMSWNQRMRYLCDVKVVAELPYTSILHDWDRKVKFFCRTLEGGGALGSPFYLARLSWSRSSWWPVMCACSEMQLSRTC